MRGAVDEAVRQCCEAIYFEIFPRQVLRQSDMDTFSIPCAFGSRKVYRARFQFSSSEWEMFR